MNTNKTYVAFDAQGVYDHEHSNLHYHQQMREWQRQYPQRYAFLNMQDIDFSSMHEDLIDSTFKVRCLRQMAEADNLLVLASDLMNVESTTLNWQISRAVNRFRLPVIVAYVGYDSLVDASVKHNWANLPNKVRKYIGRDSAYMAHVPFTKDKLERALGAYSVKKGLYPWNSTTIF